MFLDLVRELGYEVAHHSPIFGTTCKVRVSALVAANAQGVITQYTVRAIKAIEKVSSL